MVGSVKKVMGEVTEMLNYAMNEQSWEVFSSVQRNLELHPSSFPYCGVKHLYDFMQEAPSPVTSDSFGGSYFMNVGTLVHVLIQRAVGMSGKVWGHWKCSLHDKGLCGYEDLETLSVYHDCPVCGQFCDYEEIGYNIDGLLVGHQDCLFEDSDGDFWVLDYKTCMLMKAQKHKKDGVTLAGNNGYRAQQTTYCTLAHKTYGKSHGIRPKGWILVYMPRDVPFQFCLYGEDVSSALKKETWERICHDMSALEVVLDAKEFSEIEPLIASKPCKSMSHYNETMASLYGVCSLLPVCFNKKALNQTLKMEMDGNVLLPMRKTYAIAIKGQKELLNDVRKAQKKYHKITKNGLEE